MAMQEGVIMENKGILQPIDDFELEKLETALNRAEKGFENNKTLHAGSFKTEKAAELLKEAETVWETVKGDETFVEGGKDNLAQHARDLAFEKGFNPLTRTSQSLVSLSRTFYYVLKAYKDLEDFKERNKEV